MSLTVKAAARTHIGLVRRRNEDAVYSGRVLFAAADGLGGHTAGDVASTTVIDALRAYDREVAPAELTAVLGQAVSSEMFCAHRVIQNKPPIDLSRWPRIVAARITSL
ncbi:hypothetical protein [Microtetraspora sp. NBRC 16547]|uniref:PP2C family protein-serine/threonine phosphatase n=1 Tax=Microtetraspora sp. NBRC 16547 TaxID=3030993 RepID=UPI0024A26F66|nr:hypothetical protein [Microtetraspora sp. NBRC 16547]GLX01081.1 hypothetical protein Misp02_51670 [Microtetraspora sp. NBRC 16547]